MTKFFLGVFLLLSGAVAEAATWGCACTTTCNHSYAPNTYAPGDAPPASSDFSLFGTSWSSTTVTYSFMAGGTSTSSQYTDATFTAVNTLNASFESEIRRAFDAWEAVVGLRFVEVADDGAAFNANTTSGDIRFGAANIDGPNNTLAVGFYPPPNGNSAAGDIHFDTSETWVVGFPGSGFDIFQVAAHEIGHAIGLEHTGVANSLMNATYSEAFSGPQADDIAGGQALYGGALGAVPEPSTGMLLSVMALFVARMRRSWSNVAATFYSFFTPPETAMARVGTRSTSRAPRGSSAGRGWRRSGQQRRKRRY